MRPNSLRAAAGFTLLELLVVLAIIGLLLAVTTPIFSQVYARARFALDREDVEQQLLVLPVKVRDAGRAGFLADANATLDPAPAEGPMPEAWQALQLRLPSGWRMEVPKPIIYHFTGTCDGGEVVFSVASLSVTYDLAAPLCRPQIAHADAS